jgi:DNA polymerase
MSKLTTEQKIQAVIATWETCRECHIGGWAKNHVFWRGTAVPAPLVFIGEGPGRKEDETGTPFVGRAGQLLDEMMAEAGLKHLPHAMINLVCCRPCDTRGGPNRAPSNEEINNCAPRLQAMLDIFRPSTVALLGKVPSAAWNELKPLNNVVAFHLYHPAYTLRSGSKDSAAYKETVHYMKIIRRGVFGE